MKFIQKKCKNCDDSAISQDGGTTWVHGIIANGRPWLTPINSLCISSEG